MYKLFIKNMVCDRCIMVVNNELKALGITPVKVVLGVVEFNEELSISVLQEVSSSLKKMGFELVIDKKSQIILQIKGLIIDLIYNKSCIIKTNLSDYLEQNLLFDYNYISNIFSEIEKTTIEKYFIMHKVQRVKELLEYGELTLTEIAHQLNYSSVAHLSNQFKSITKISPSKYKDLKLNNRKSLDQI